jgi:hypothetical protein
MSLREDVTCLLFEGRIADNPGEILVRRGLRLLHCTGVWYALACVQASFPPYGKLNGCNKGTLHAGILVKNASL